MSSGQGYGAARGANDGVRDGAGSLTIDERKGGDIVYQPAFSLETPVTTAAGRIPPAIVSALHQTRVSPELAPLVLGHELAARPSYACLRQACETLAAQGASGTDLVREIFQGRSPDYVKFLLTCTLARGAGPSLEVLEGVKDHVLAFWSEDPSRGAIAWAVLLAIRSAGWTDERSRQIAAAARRHPCADVRREASLAARAQVASRVGGTALRRTALQRARAQRRRCHRQGVAAT